MKKEFVCIKNHYMEDGTKTHTKGSVYRFKDKRSINDQGECHYFTQSSKKDKKYFEKHFQPYKLTFKNKAEFAKALIKYGELYFENVIFYYNESKVNPFRIDTWGIEAEMDDSWGLFNSEFTTILPPKVKKERVFEDGFYFAKYSERDNIEVIKITDSAVSIIDDVGTYSINSFYKIYNKIEEPNI